MGPAVTWHAIAGFPSFTWFGIEVLRYPAAILLQLDRDSLRSLTSLPISFPRMLEDHDLQRTENFLEAQVACLRTGKRD